MNIEPINTLEVFVRAARDLWLRHEHDMNDLMTRSPDKFFRFAFQVIIDASGKVPRMTTRIAWSERVTDEIESQLDTNQLKLFKDK